MSSGVFWLRRGLLNWPAAVWTTSPLISLRWQAMDQHTLCEKCDHRADKLFPLPCWRTVGKSDRLCCQSSSTLTHSDGPLQPHPRCSLGSPYYKFGGFKSSNKQIKIGTILVTQIGTNFLSPRSIFNFSPITKCLLFYKSPSYDWRFRWKNWEVS